MITYKHYKIYDVCKAKNGKLLKFLHFFVIIMCKIVVAMG